MARNTFAAILLAVVLVFDATASAQPTNVRRRGPITGQAQPSARSSSTQGWAPRGGQPMLRSDAARNRCSSSSQFSRRNNSNPHLGGRRHSNPPCGGRHTELYTKRPGQYVIGQPYGPTRHSPTFRSCPPRISVQHGWQRRGWVSSPRFTGSRGNWGYWVPSRPTIAYAPSYYSGHGWISSGDDWATGYEQGRYDADHDYIEYIAAQRAGRLLNQWAVQFDEAIILFRAGRYEQAAINMLGAAEKNHADGASRLHAGHCLFALGRYEEAIPLIERAFELAPSLAYNSYDIRDEYGDKAQFEGHVEALKAYVVRHPESAGAVTLLGYVTYYSEGPSAAYPYLKRAASLNSGSYFVPKLLAPASMVRPTIEGLPAGQQQGAPARQDELRQDKTKMKATPLAPDRSGRVVARAASSP